MNFCDNDFTQPQVIIHKPCFSVLIFSSFGNFAVFTDSAMIFLFRKIKLFNFLGLNQEFGVTKNKSCG